MMMVVMIGVVRMMIDGYRFVDIVAILPILLSKILL